MNKEFNRMLKLAGLMTEGLYTSDEKAPMEGMPSQKMTKKELKAKIKEMMAPLPGEGAGIRRGRMYFHVLEDGGYGDIGHQGVYHTKEEAQNRADKLADMFPNSSFYVEASDSKEEPYSVTMEEGTIGQEAEEEMGSMDEYDTQGLTNAASVVDHYLKTAYDAGSAGTGFDDSLAYEMMDHLKQFSGEMGSMEENASDIPNSVSKSSVELLVAAAKRVVGALRDSGFEQEDIYDYIMDRIKTLSVDEALFEAKKDEEESDTEDVIVAEPGEGEVPAEDVAVDVADTNTQVDVNMDGVPDVDTGSAESKKAFTSLVDTYNSAKELGDPKLTQMIANALTYYNKNIILKSGQPQA